MTTNPFEPPVTSPAGNLYPRPPRHAPRGAHLPIESASAPAMTPSQRWDASRPSQRRTSARRSSVTCGLDVVEPGRGAGVEKAWWMSRVAEDVTPMMRREGSRSSSSRVASTPLMPASASPSRRCRARVRDIRDNLLAGRRFTDAGDAVRFGENQTQYPPAVALSSPTRPSAGDRRCRCGPAVAAQRVRGRPASKRDPNRAPRPA
jgi:hypothetical protein